MIRVQNPGPLTTLQDGGRKGLGHQGITTGGPMDRPAAVRALQLVGADEKAPLIEALYDGLVLETLEGLLVAITGEGARPQVNGRAAPADRLLRLSPGDRLRLSPSPRGRYRYIAVAGPWHLTRVAGSASYHPQLLAGARLKASDVLTVDGAAYRLTDYRAEVDAPTGPLHYYPHPELDPDYHRTYRASLTDAISRMGTRLTGDFPELSAHDRLSTALYPGAIQLPTKGEAICMMADHPTVGGYVLLGTMTPASLARLAQMRPGEAFSLSPVALDHRETGVTTRYIGRPPETGKATHYQITVGPSTFGITVEER